MSAHNRIRAIARLTHDRGLSREAAEVIALAIFPLDVGPEAEPVSRRFPKKVNKRIKRFRKTAQKASRDVLVDLARETIEDYLDLAVTYGEDYYIARFQEATAGPAPWVGGSIQAMPGASPESVVDDEIGEKRRVETGLPGQSDR
jgi:hypothetical protein